MATSIRWEIDTKSARKSSEDRLFTSSSTAVRSASRTNASSMMPESAGFFSTSFPTASRARTPADLATARLRSPSAFISRDWMAENMIANPRTRLMSSSSLSCSSCAASSSSFAMLKDTETERSEPMDESVPKVVPPTPPVTCVPAGLVGAPLMLISGSLQITREEAQRAAHDQFQGLGAFFQYQRDASIYFRRLVLTLPTSGKRTRDYATITVCGSAFGTTLGSLCMYLEGRGIPAERAYVLRSVRTQLLPIADALGTMQGADVAYLSRGLASCRVATAQRAMLPAERKIDSKYGNAHTCIGATASLLTCFGVLSAVSTAHAAHLGRDNSLGKALRCALVNLENWKASRIAMSEDAWLALAVERRALQRASAGARRAAYVAQDKPPAELLQKQLEWARLAAFPANCSVDEFSQASLLNDVETRAVKVRQAGTVQRLETVPLSQIPTGRLLARGDSQLDDSSDAASSWATTISSNTSAFSCVSRGSLDGDLLVDLSLTF